MPITNGRNERDFTATSQKNNTAFKIKIKKY